MNNMGMYGLAGMQGMGRSIGGRAMRGAETGAILGMSGYNAVAPVVARHPMASVGLAGGLPMAGMAGMAGMAYGMHRRRSSGRHGLRGRSSGGMM